MGAPGAVPTGASGAVPTGAPGAGPHRFPALDGLRAVAASAVVLTHVAFWAGAYTQDWLGRALARGDVGVALFFVLSGFLLSLPWLRSGFDGGARPGVGTYLWRRALRILPAYWLVVVVALLLLPGNRDADAGDWWRQLTLLQIYGPGWASEGLVHLWSLSTEVAFYLVLPFLARAVLWCGGRGEPRPGRVLAALAVVAAAGLGWLVRADGVPPEQGPVNLWLPAFLPWFCAGMALAVIVVTGRRTALGRTAHDLAAGPGTCWALAGVLFWIACTPVAGPLGLDDATVGQVLTKHLLYLGVATLLVLPLVVGEHRTGPVHAVLTSWPMRRLGEISYGLFLYHMVVLVMAAQLLGWEPFTGRMVMLLVITWGGGVLLAALSHRYLEAPLAARWRDPRARRAGPARPGRHRVSRNV